MPIRGPQVPNYRSFLPLTYRLTIVSLLSRRVENSHCFYQLRYRRRLTHRHVLSHEPALSRTPEYACISRFSTSNALYQARLCTVNQYKPRLASSPLVSDDPLQDMAQHNEQHDVTAVAESLIPLTPSSPTSNVTPNTSGEPYTELLYRLDDDQRGSFLRLWSTVPPHIRQMDFALDAPGWDPSAIDALSATLTEYVNIFPPSKLDYDACSLRPFEIKVPPGTHPIQSQPYRLNPVLSKQVEAILDSYLAAGLIQRSTSPWSSPLVCVPKKSGGIRITANYQKLNKVT